MSTIELNTTKDETDHLNSIEAYSDRIKKIINQIVGDYIALQITMHLLSPKKRFSFSLFTKAERSLQKIFQNAKIRLTDIIQSGIKKEWRGDTTNVNEFINREINGLTLSDRIDNLINNIRQEAEAIIDVGLPNIKNSDLLAYRLIEKYGSTVSKPKSSYYIASSLVFGELHTAYRFSKLLEWQDDDAIIGFEVKRTHRETKCDVCNNLTGVYPKDFIFLGWHIKCLCYAEPIYGKKPITEIPKSAQIWWNNNQNGLNSYLPYFITDNAKFFNVTNSIIGKSDLRGIYIKNLDVKGKSLYLDITGGLSTALSDLINRGRKIITNYEKSQLIKLNELSVRNKIKNATLYSTKTQKILDHEMATIEKLLSLGDDVLFMPDAYFKRGQMKFDVIVFSGNKYYTADLKSISSKNSKTIAEDIYYGGKQAGNIIVDAKNNIDANTLASGIFNAANSSDKVKSVVLLYKNRKKTYFRNGILSKGFVRNFYNDFHK